MKGVNLTSNDHVFLPMHILRCEARTSACEHWSWLYRLFWFIVDRLHGAFWVQGIQTWFLLISTGYSSLHENRTWLIKEPGSVQIICESNENKIIHTLRRASLTLSSRRSMVPSRVLMSRSGFRFDQLSGSWPNLVGLWKLGEKN